MNSSTPRFRGEWPALTYEVHDWRPADATLFSHRRRRAASGPYESALIPSIADLPVHLPSELATEAEEAAVEIARFDNAASEVLGDREIAPISAVLMRSESAASSQIENITVGARQLALAQLGEEANVNARLVSGNVSAMQAALNLAGEISTGTILEMHAALMSRQSHHAGGEWRTQQVWIGGDAAGPHRAAFVPPHHSHVRAAMDDLVTFTARTDLPALVHAAIAHAQFETIHPFTDGNGRTGRALVHAMVRRSGLSRRVTVPISAGLLTDTEAYVAWLTSYREGELAPLLAGMIEATFRALANGHRLLTEIHEISARWRGAITARRGAAAWRTIDLLIGQPVVTVRFVQAQLGVSAHTAQTAIDTLESAGILTQAVAGRRRNRTWHAREVTEALDAFAERAGRRN
ncbi:Fic family protein [Ruania alkalisoli]|uniref:Fic family protein n=1 Tax=Ruania alkalisoli TaxID=2779775 RepID=A0A7M1SUJ0_9MICO|nr:Fic family protein [Ruania alkalisoli]QOR70283.1 Fic family protein [Ruania alkalisoli]